MVVYQILSRYGIPATASVLQLTSGLINTTWKVTHQKTEYILQKVNEKVFKNPELIAANTLLLKKHLRSIRSDYFLATEIPSLKGRLVVEEEGAYYRLLPYVKNAHTVSVAQTPQQAYEAAYQFGLFTKTFERLDISCLHTTIPHFHDLLLRYNQFLQAIENGNEKRVGACTMEIEELKSYSFLVGEWQLLCNHSEVKTRVTHHDTKISNVLFNAEGDGICVIDLDTVMPGYFFSDVGDMMRTYLPPVNEDDTDFSKVCARPEYFQAIAKGYLTNMAAALSGTELKVFAKTGMWLTYMQALRFLTDYFNNDQYYGTGYEGQNRSRARNQLALLRSLSDNHTTFQLFVSHFFG